MGIFNSNAHFHSTYPCVVHLYPSSTAPVFYDVFLNIQTLNKWVKANECKKMIQTIWPASTFAITRMARGINMAHHVILASTSCYSVIDTIIMVTTRFTANNGHWNRTVDWLMDWLIYWFWFIDLLIYWFIDWLIRLIDWPYDCFVRCFLPLFIIYNWNHGVSCTINKFFWAVQLSKQQRVSHNANCTPLIAKKRESF